MNSHVARLISPNRLRLAGYRPARETHHKSVRAYVLPQPRDPPSPLHSPFPSVPASEEGAAGLGRGKIAAKWISVSLSVAAGSFFFFCLFIILVCDLWLPEARLREEDGYVCRMAEK